MCKKMAVCIGLAIVFIMGACGPKGASTETLNQLEETRQALESAKAKLAECESENADLQSQITEKEQFLKNLEKERDSLAEILDAIKKGY